jgi:hypothetical protein
VNTNQYGSTTPTYTHRKSFHFCLDFKQLTFYRCLKSYIICFIENPSWFANWAAKCYGPSITYMISEYLSSTFWISMKSVHDVDELLWRVGHDFLIDLFINRLDAQSNPPENERSSIIATSYHSQPFTDHLSPRPRRLVADTYALQNLPRTSERRVQFLKNEKILPSASPFSDRAVPVWGRPKDKDQEVGPVPSHSTVNRKLPSPRRRVVGNAVGSSDRGREQGS